MSLVMAQALLLKGCWFLFGLSSRSGAQGLGFAEVEPGPGCTAAQCVSRQACH